MISNYDIDLKTEEKTYNLVKREIYSLDETDTGKIWIDGKKIYRKTFNIPSIQPRIEYGIDISSLNISDFITAVGFVKFINSYWINIFTSDELEISLNVFTAFLTSKIRIIPGQKRTIEKGHITIEYTKTT